MAIHLNGGDRPHLWRYFRNCVDWPRWDVEADGGLSEMIDRAYRVKRPQFMRAVNQADRVTLEDSLGYVLNYQQPGLMMKNDLYVTYFRSRLHGWPVYFVEHSCIEHVFIPPILRQWYDKADASPIARRRPTLFVRPQVRIA